MKRFDGKVVVITGGGSGMGKISCTLFAQEGASVCVVDINEKTAKATADEIIAAGGKAKAYAIDITNEAAVEALLMMLLPHLDDSMCILQLQASARSVLQ